jgi:hypothetical protein
VGDRECDRDDHVDQLDQKQLRSSVCRVRIRVLDNLTNHQTVSFSLSHVILVLVVPVPRAPKVFFLHSDPSPFSRFIRIGIAIAIAIELHHNEDDTFLSLSSTLDLAPGEMCSFLLLLLFLLMRRRRHPLSLSSYLSKFENQLLSLAPVEGSSSSSVAAVTESEDDAEED